MPQPRLFLIDSFGFIFRAYHARARSSAPPMRTSTGLSTEAVFIFQNMVRRLQKQWEPAFIAAVFESETPTLREAAYAEYKANRAETPPDLLEQIPYVRRTLEAMQIPVLEYPGYEADDVIGALARQAEAAGVEVVIVSSDKDMLQLVTPRVSMLNPAKDDAWYGPAEVLEFLGVTPAQVPDLLALKGDAVDNIPGAPGIGDKGARDLISRFGGVEEAIAHAVEVERKAYRESLQNHVAQIRLSRQLATIATDVPIVLNLDELAARPADPALLKTLFQELEFHSLLKELGPAADARPRDYATLEDPAQFGAWLAAAASAPVAVAVSQPGKDGLGLDSIGLAWREGEARAVPTHALAALKPWLEDPAAPKLAWDVKQTLHRLSALGVEGKGFAHDAMLCGFLLDADPSACSLDEQARRQLDLKLGPAPEQRADIARELWSRFEPQLAPRGMARLYAEVEMPLVPVLAAMERAGVLVDLAELRRLSVGMEQSVARVSARVFELAGKPFNISSPQQLGKVLFEDLGLPAPRTAKGKSVSTAADVLEALAGGHEIVRLVLEYRQLTKLKGTYVDALPELVNPATGRLHTSFNQAGAATGRLSSSNPNLQNIPIRTEMGREIRAAFIPRPGWKLLVADYSQIELRLLAHYSKDRLLVEAFREGDDIHTRTAAEVMGVPPMMVTPEARREAKAVNFGIVYGISGFGLAAQLGITRAEAERYIRNYFERYAGVRRFLDETVAEVRQTGVTRTLFGRERAIPDINSGNPNARGFAERTAVNSPLQGTAADLIKLAMVRIAHALRQGGFESAMLLQVHDELVFECPEAELEPVAALVKREMEGACALEVPLVAELGTGANWRDAK